MRLYNSNGKILRANGEPGYNDAEHIEHIYVDQYFQLRGVLSFINTQLRKLITSSSVASSPDGRVRSRINLAPPSLVLCHSFVISLRAKKSLLYSVT